uniref:Uncharacterized protein n=1 Tax=Panagrolaimus sp. PS1159 TaxID=55785 RepID=A0AC35FSX9_9BILA
MAIKDSFFIVNNKQESFVNTHTEIGNRYSNLNLNQKHKLSRLSSNHSQSKQYKNNLNDSKVSVNYKVKEKPKSWNKSPMTNLHSKASTFFTLNDDDEKAPKEQWKKDSSKTTNKSTLFLHIAAVYEKTFETHESETFDDKNIGDLKKEKFDSIKDTNFNALSTFVIQLPPEPRFIPGVKDRKFTHSRFYDRLRYIVRLPLANSFTRGITVVCLLIATTNALAYVWKGPGHPLNRYRWNQMKARGELTPEMLEKEKLLSDYVVDNWVNPREPLKGVRPVM